MLVNLDFDKKYVEDNPKVQLIKEFDTSDGLRITTEYTGNWPDKTKTVAKRLQEGVYEAKAFIEDIPQYTKWEIDYGRSPVCRYGTADSLDQIIKYGKPLIESEQPYVLGIVKIDQKRNGEFKWKRHGVYIGSRKLGETFADTPEIEDALIFSFFKLREKAGSQ